MLRRTLSSMNPVDAMEQLTKQLGKFKTNAEFIKLISRPPGIRLDPIDRSVGQASRLPALEQARR